MIGGSSQHLFGCCRSKVSDGCKLWNDLGYRAILLRCFVEHSYIMQLIFKYCKYSHTIHFDYF